ncbi:MAG: ComEC/Rec2 family competence protein [Lentisphaeria bacterium]|nr:ComEC/Rec2 family competence protein [Lentisphaeria bacterium]
MNTAPAFWQFGCFAAGAAGAACQLSGLLLLLIACGVLFCCWLGRGTFIRHFSSLLLTLAGYCLSCLFLACPWETYLRQMPRQEGYAQLFLRICEAPALPSELQELSSGREKWHAEILAMRNHLNATWQPATGKVLLQSSKAMRSQLQQLELGQMLIAEGCLLLPPSENSPGGYYGRHLRIIGIHRVFLLQAIRRRLGTDTGLQIKTTRWLQKIRGVLALHLVSGLDHPDAARMLLALGLGMKELLRSETNQRFIRSGTIHIFSISGLHVGMVVLLAESFFRSCGLALRLRWFLLVPMLLSYLLLTGNSPSVLRAFNMSLLFLYACWRFRPPSALNSLGFSGLLALIGNPLYILHSGFLYSYLIVMVLILAWGPIREGKAVLLERRHWIPRQYQGWHRLEGTLANLAAALASSALAWLGSAGITLRINGQLCLLSPLINLPLGSTVFLILAFCPLKLLLAFVCPAAQKFSNGVAVVLLNSLQFWAETAADSSLTWNAVPFSNLENFLYHLALGLWLLLITAKYQEKQRAR